MDTLVSEVITAVVSLLVNVLITKTAGFTGTYITLPYISAKGLKKKKFVSDGFLIVHQFVFAVAFYLFIFLIFNESSFACQLCFSASSHF